MEPGLESRGPDFTPQSALSSHRGKPAFHHVTGPCSGRKNEEIRGSEVVSVSIGRSTEDRTNRKEQDEGIALRFRLSILFLPLCSAAPEHPVPVQH